MFEDCFADYKYLMKTLEAYTYPINSTKYALETLDGIRHLQSTIADLTILLTNTDKPLPVEMEELINCTDSLIRKSSEPYLQNLGSNFFMITNELSSILHDALHQSFPFMTEEQRKECSHIIEPITDDIHRAGISFERLMLLLTFLLGLYTAILATLPNKQFDKLANQQDIIIEQHADIADELHKANEDDDELVQAINSLTSAIVALNDEIEVLRDKNDILTDEVDSLRSQTEDFSNLNNHESKNEAIDSQDKPATTQN